MAAWSEPAERPEGFDPLFDFLLETVPDSLFTSRTLDTELDFVCKGCGGDVKRWDREKHHAKHKRDRLKARQREIARNRELALVKARAARKARTT